jgi:hypothetical protein
MKVRALALNTFASLVRNKLIILFSAVFHGMILLMMTPLVALRTMTSTHPRRPRW